jgi:hypothetical protein
MDSTTKKLQTSSESTYRCFGVAVLSKLNYGLPKENLSVSSNRTYRTISPLQPPQTAPNNLAFMFLLKIYIHRGKGY